MDLNDIINTLIAEANAEGPEGMRRVGETILNRAAIRGIDPAAVVRQPHQYTGFGAPGPLALQAQRNPQVRTAAEAAWELARQPGDPTNGADHYHADGVNPDWANSLTRTGQHGQHQFYRSSAVPSEALAALLAPSAPAAGRYEYAPNGRPRDPGNGFLMSTDDPRYPDAVRGSPNAALASPPPTPAMPSAALNALRGPQFNGDPRTPSNGPVVASFPSQPMAANNLFGDDPGTPADGSVVARIPSQPRQPITTNDLFTSSGISDTARNTQAQQSPGLAAALEGFLRPTAAPAMPTNVAQSYAGQDGVGPAAQRAASNLFNGDPGMPAAGQTVASFPTAQPARVSASDMARGQGVLSPSSVQAVANMFSGDPGTPARGQTVASIPTVAKAQVSASDFARSNSGSGIGQTPATRTVASVPVPAPSRQTESRADPVGTAPMFNEIASMFGQNVPGPSGTTAVKTQDRLPATPGPKVNASAPGPALFGGLDPRLAGAAPTPRSASDAVRARAPKPTTKTVTERTVNPAWTAAQKAAKIDPVGDMPSWGDFASTFAAPKPAAKMPPQYITRTRQVPATPTPAVRAPVPFSRPVAPQRAPLRITVNGGNVQQPQSAPSNWAPQGYTNDGTGKITSNETGGIYYERHLRK